MHFNIPDQSLWISTEKELPGEWREYVLARIEVQPGYDGSGYADGKKPGDVFWMEAFCLCGQWYSANVRLRRGFKVTHWAEK